MDSDSIKIIRVKKFWASEFFTCTATVFMYNAQLDGSQIPDDLKCTNPLCNKKKYQESKTVFDYCGITCRDLHRIQQQENPQLPFLIPGRQSGRGLIMKPLLYMYTTGSNIKQCLLPGCKLARHRNIKADDDSSLKSFCGMQHRKKAEELGKHKRVYLLQ